MAFQRCHCFFSFLSRRGGGSRARFDFNKEILQLLLIYLLLDQGSHIKLFNPFQFVVEHKSKD